MFARRVCSVGMTSSPLPRGYATHSKRPGFRYYLVQGRYCKTHGRARNLFTGLGHRVAAITFTAPDSRGRHWWRSWREIASSRRRRGGRWIKPGKIVSVLRTIENAAYRKWIGGGGGVFVRCEIERGRKRQCVCAQSVRVCNKVRLIYPSYIIARSMWASNDTVAFTVRRVC